MKTTAQKFPTFGQRRVLDPNGGTGISERREPARVEHVNGRLVEVRPDEELPTGFCVNLRRILVPTSLDEASAVAIDYAAVLARRFSSELALLYAFDDYAQSPGAEAELWTCFSALQLENLKVRLFLMVGRVGEQVKAVADALGADLIVTSHDYHRQFLSCWTQAETGILRGQGVSCPVVLVNAVFTAKGLGTDVPLARGVGAAA